MSGFGFNPGTSSGGTPGDNTVTSAKIVDGTIVNADINAAAAVAYSKLNLASSVVSADIVDGTIVDGDVNASAAIAKTKISGTALTAADSGTVTTTILASGIPQSLTSSGSSTKAVADSSAHVIGGAPVWNGTGWLGLGSRYYYNNGSNANVAETLPRGASNSAAVAIGTTGVMTSYAIELVAGMVITNLNFRWGSTAGSVMTHWWFALYDTQATPALIAQTSDQTNAAISASSTTTLALGSPAPYTVATTGTYYVSVMVAATTIPTLAGVQTIQGLNAAVASGQKSLAVTSGSALTTTAPGTITSSAGLAGVGYVATS